MKDLIIDPKQVTIEIVQFLSQIFQREGFSKAVIAISGGVDSATSLALTVKALGPRCVFPVFLPYGELNKQGVLDAEVACAAYGIPQDQWSQIDISPHVDSIISTDAAMNNVRKGNIMARVRMIFIYDMAKKMNALVVGTENKSEHYLGYYTRFGDEASDIEPLRELYKTQVYQLATYLNVPDVILKKAPSAGLWNGQTDEGEFGFGYQEADEILFLYEQHIPVSKIVERMKNNGNTQRVINHIKTMKYKQNLPYTMSTRDISSNKKENK